MDSKDEIIEALKQLAEAQAALLAAYRMGRIQRGATMSRDTREAKEKLERLGVTGKW